MARPLIAVSSRPRQPGEVSQWPVTAAAVMQMTYLEALWRAGGDEAIIAPRVISDGQADDLLARVDGLILVGGGDMDPAQFGQEPDPEVYGVEPASDALELALARAALRSGKPLLAICRGLQVLNVALGGTLHQHITGQMGTHNHGDPRHGHAEHPVTVEPGTLLAKAIGGASGIEACWSYHHQAIDRVADPLVVTARSADGVVEAVELADAHTKGWMVGIQWHPERTAHHDPQQQALFDALVTAAERNQGGAVTGDR